MIRSLLRRSMAAEPRATGASWGILVLRLGLGSMVFVIHGYHKLLGGSAWLHDGSPWPLADEVAEMHFPMPVAAAFAATAAQLVCPLFLLLGLLTRLNALILTGTLGVAVLQNLTAGRDPQLAVLYVLAYVSLVLSGGGRWSLDASRSRAGRP